MSSELIQVLMLLAAAIVMFAINRPRLDIVALIMLTALPLTGVLTMGEALAGFSDSNIVLIAALFVIGDGLVRTGVARRIGDGIAARAGHNETKLNALLMAAVFALFAIHLTGGFPALLLLVFMVISSTSVIQSNTMAGALSVDPTRAGTAAALFGATAFAGGTAMSFVSGLLYRGTPRAMIAVMALGLLGTAASLHFKALPEDAAPIAE